MPKFVKRPEIIEAVRVPMQANDTIGWRELSRFLGREVGPTSEKMVDLNGVGLYFDLGDWIVKVNGGFKCIEHTCFVQTHEPHH